MLIALPVQLMLLCYFGMRSDGDDDDDDDDDGHDQGDDDHEDDNDVADDGFKDVFLVVGVALSSYINAHTLVA